MNATNSRSPKRHLWRPLRQVCLVRCDDGERPLYALDPATISDPLRWNGGREVDVKEDLFDSLIDINTVAAIFAVMASSARHRFHLRTQNGDAMRRWFAWITLGGTSAVAIYNAGHEVHHAPLAGRVDPPTPELRFLYDVGAPRVNPHLRGIALKRERMGEFHWREWPLDNVSIEEGVR